MACSAAFEGEIVYAHAENYCRWCSIFKAKKCHDHYFLCARNEAIFHPGIDFMQIPKKRNKLFHYFMQKLFDILKMILSCQILIKKNPVDQQHLIIKSLNCP